LTLILKRSEKARDFVTGGQPSVGLRVPSHPVAQELLKNFRRRRGRAVREPLRPQSRPRPAAHVREDLGADVDLILEGGASGIGIESTIVDLSSGDAVLLRPGAISHQQLQQLII